MAHILNRILPLRLRLALRRIAELTIPSLRHLDMRMRLAQMASIGLQPRLIVDVGAARGDWARMAAKIWPRARILGVEPNHSRVGELEATRRQLPAFTYWRGFLGPEPGKVVYADKAELTSLLDMTANTAGSAEAAMTTLDQLLQDMSLPDPDLLKLDVQGYELQVLKGASRSLRACQAVLMEVSFFQFFPEMPLAAEVVRWMAEQDFEWHDVMGLWRRERDDALAQMDFLFLRRGHPLRSSNAMF